MAKIDAVMYKDCMDLGIEGKTALITGAGRGLGKAIATSLAKEGASIIANSRTQADLVELVKELPTAPKRAHSYFCYDLTLKEGPERLLSFLKEQQTFPDIIVHNLGGNLGVTDPLCSLEDWQAVMRVNLEVPIELNRALVPFMQKNRWGRICHTASISGLENQGPPSYCAAKAGLIAYTRSLGRYLAKDGIVITSVLPGAVFTEGGYWDMASKTRADHVQKFLAERMAIQRFGTPAEISSVVAFLCSHLASFCVGSAFLVDGGQGRTFQEIS